VRDGNDDGILNKWISYLESMLGEESRKIIDTIEDGEQLNALHMAALINNENVLKKFCDFGAGTNLAICMQHVILQLKILLLAHP